MTKRLYLGDPYVTEFEAEITERVETPEGPAVLFEATYFYPESGGQPYDLGTIDGAAVRKVTEDGERILHFVDRLPNDDKVRCVIDAFRRRDHMQQHSGQHILSAAFVKEAEAQTLSFHLGAASSTIDLDQADLTEEDVERAERAANDAVRRSLPISSRFVAAGDAGSLDLRKPPPDAETLRIVAIEGFDQQACCGTHPRSSGEVGPIVVRGLERFKGGTRVEFLCGDRALRDYRTTVFRVRALASALSSSEADLVATASKLQEERKVLGKELEKLRRELLLVGVEDWMRDAVEVGTLQVLVKTIEGAGPAELRSAATELTKKANRAIFLGSVAEGRAHLVFGCSESLELDMSQLLRESLDSVEGRGGGSKRMAQGGGPKLEGLAEALERARRSVVG